jgi:hypothetical protein
MPYAVNRTWATHYEIWDGNNLDDLKSLVPGYFDFYEIDPDTKAITAQGNTYAVGSIMMNAGGSPGIVLQEDFDANFQVVPVERPWLVYSYADTPPESPSA